MTGCGYCPPPPYVCATCSAACCRLPGACPAHAAGDCTWTPPRLELTADPEVEALLDALAGPGWRDTVTAHLARKEHRP